MSKQIIILGGGGHGRVALDALLANGANVLGVLDSDLDTGLRIFGIPTLGGDDALEKFNASDVLLVNGLGANPSTERRKHLFETMKSRGFSFDTFQHLSVKIGQECEFGEGSQVMAGSVLQHHVRIGENVVVNTSGSIDHDCTLSNHSFVSPGSVLCGNVSVGKEAFIGAGAVVLPGVQIGANAIVGAGAVVTGDIPSGWVVAGNPAAKIGVNE